MYRCGIETTAALGLVLLLQGLNCTVVELKQTDSAIPVPTETWLNCTVVELKRKGKMQACALDDGLIVPLWN